MLNKQTNKQTNIFSVTVVTADLTKMHMLWRYNEVDYTVALKGHA